MRTIFMSYEKLLIAFFMVLLLNGCVSTQRSAQDKTCDVKTIILDEKIFMNNVKLGTISSPAPESPPESASREFFFNVSNGVITNHAIQIVERYRYLKYAKEEFNELDKALFEDTWYVPDELDGLELSATEYQLACGLDLSELTCRFVARYSEYVVYFGSDIADNGMSLNIFFDSVNEIDTRIRQCFKGQ